MELVHTVAKCNDLCGADKCAAKYTRALIENVYILCQINSDFVKQVPGFTYKSSG